MSESKYSAKTTFILLFTPATLLAKSAHLPNTDIWAKVSINQSRHLFSSLHQSGNWQKVHIHRIRIHGRKKVFSKADIYSPFYTSKATGKQCTVTGYGYMGESKLLIGLGTEFRSENIPRNRLGMISVIPRKKVLIPKHSEFRGRVNSEARNGTERNEVPRKN